MAFLNKTYKFVKQENFEGFLTAVGVAADKQERVLKYAPDHKLTKDGDTYTYTTQGAGSSKETKFQSGVAVDDVIGEQKQPIKSTYVVDGNTVTQNVVGDTGKAIFKREYVGDECIVTITADNWDGVAKRYYKAA